uniref:Choline transporter-like protein n=1 Tax=Zooxanthella nutricula TaxID=1333877 RepID=A0A6U6KYM8_9DINO
MVYGALADQQAFRTDPLLSDEDGIREGGQRAQANPAFPADRKFRDVFWAALFLVVFVGTLASAMWFSSKINVHWKHRADHVADTPEMWALLVAGLVAMLASSAASLAFFGLVAVAPSFVVWTSLLFQPAFMIASGAILICFGGTAAIAHASCFILVGLLALAITFCCLWRHIPFMILVVETVSRVITSNPAMAGVSVLGSLLAALWLSSVSLAAAGAHLALSDKVDGSNPSAGYGFLFVLVFVFVWGSQVFHNVCHLTYCGVVGRWYHGVDEHAAVSKSLGVACTTSFGSVCFGSFLVALVRAVQAVVDRAATDAENNRNIACCVILTILKCIVECIGDILQYFNEWAYVQCAIRGTSFLESASITKSMLTCANVKYIVQDLFIDSVAFFGALLCSLVGMGAGALVGWSFNSLALWAGGFIGFLSGLMAGSAATSILSSGAKTILALWAEDTAPLRLHRPEVHKEFEQRIFTRARV